MPVGHLLLLLKSSNATQAGIVLLTTLHALCAKTRIASDLSLVNINNGQAITSVFRMALFSKQFTHMIRVKNTSFNLSSEDQGDAIPSTTPICNFS
ncbi:hypothetical protein EI94DRAFT_750325 [Lactarius quietus]|nr:hypothetical protein EI94DRAFT_750325 [Lactarius quietus]